MKSIYNQKKCEHCNSWSNGEKAFCSTCGEILDYKYRKEIDELEKKWQNQSILMDFVKLKNSENNFFIKFIETIIRGGQLIILSIIAITTFVLMALPG